MFDNAHVITRIVASFEQVLEDAEMEGKRCLFDFLHLGGTHDLSLFIRVDSDLQHFFHVVHSLS